MQARAIFNAVITLTEKGITVKPEIMIPLVGHVNELKIMRELVIDIADKVKEETWNWFRLFSWDDD